MGDSTKCCVLKAMEIESIGGGKVEVANCCKKEERNIFL